MRTPLRLLLILVAGFRLLTLPLLRPGGFIYDYSDYVYYHLIARYAAEGFYPFIHYWMEYPPIWPWLNVALYRLSLLVPAWDDPRLIHSLLIGLTLLPFDLGILVLMHRLGRHLWGPARSIWLAAVWALLFLPLYIWSGWFDSMMLFFLLWATLGAVEGRPVVIAVAAATGMMVKLVPAVALVAPLQMWRRPEAPFFGFASRPNVRMLLVFGAIVLVVSLPFLLINPAMYLAMVRSLIARAPWETVWALVDQQYNFGIAGGDRFDPVAAGGAPPSRVPWALIHLLFAALGLWLWTRPWAWGKAAVQVYFTGLVVVLFLLWNRGWSPQFALWLLPWVLLLWPDGRGVLIAMFMSALSVAELIYFARWATLPLVLGLIVVARTGALVLIALAMYRRLRWESISPAVDFGDGQGGRAFTEQRYRRSVNPHWFLFCGDAPQNRPPPEKPGAWTRPPTNARGEIGS